MCVLISVRRVNFVDVNLACLRVEMEENDFVIDRGQKYLMLHFPCLAVSYHESQILVVCVGS